MILSAHSLTNLFACAGQKLPTWAERDGKLLAYLPKNGGLLQFAEVEAIKGGPVDQHPRGLSPGAQPATRPDAQECSDSGASDFQIRSVPICLSSSSCQDDGTDDQDDEDEELMRCFWNTAAGSICGPTAPSRPGVRCTRLDAACSTICAVFREVQTRLQIPLAAGQRDACGVCSMPWA